MAPTLGGAACWYAERGHLVFALRPGTKVPDSRFAPNGFKSSSMNPDTVRQWWLAEPRCNIGLATGHLFDVIDVDGPDGIKSIADIEDAGHLPPVLGTVITPHGFHLYIKPTGDGCTTGMLPGIDYRGVGGYICAPPTINLEPCTKDWCDRSCEGKTYRWQEPLQCESS